MDQKPFPEIFTELIGAAMALASNPGECGGFIATEVRRLTGAGVVLIIECVEHSGLDLHRLMAAAPPEAAALKARPELEELALLSHGMAAATMLVPGRASGEGRELLRAMGFGTSAVVPLCYSGNRVGALLLLDAEDAARLESVLPAMDKLAPTLAMILHNAFLYLNMEILVAQRAEELARVNSELQQSERRYRALFSESFDPVVVSEAGTGVIVDCNKAAETFFGRGREQLLGAHQRTLHSSWESEGGVSNAFARHLVDPREVLEAYVVAANGRERLVSIRASGLELDGVRCLMEVYRDITERKALKQTLTFLATNAERRMGLKFFESLAEFLAEVMDMEFVCIDRLQEDGLHARTLAVYHDGTFEDNVTYALKDTPCGEVVGKTVCCFPREVCDLFPDDPVLRDLEAQSYIGVTLWNSTGQPIGLIAVIGRHTLEETRLAQSLLQLVGVRASGELERLMFEEDTEASLREKEILLREIHHRVKNNLQIISSLLSLQERNVDNEAALQILAESRGRVASMALIHEQLYRSQTFSNIELEGYLLELLPRLVASFKGHRNIKLEIEAQSVKLCIDQAIPFGLLLNELVTNSLKHAFNGREGGTVRVRVLLDGDDMELLAEDDGVGLPSGLVLEEVSTLGLQIVTLLANQLRGTLCVMPAQGARFRLRFPLPRPATRGASQVMEPPGGNGRS